MTQEALKLALEGVEIHSPNSPEYIVCAALIEALAQTQEPWCMKMNGCKTKCEDCPDEPPQRTEQEPVANIQFMRQVLSVAIAGLYEHYKDDVLRVFTLDELQTVIDLSESFRIQQVEDIYKRAWDMIASTTPTQRTWVGLTDEETSGFTQHEMAVVKYVNKVLQENNT